MVVQVIVTILGQPDQTWICYLIHAGRKLDRPPCVLNLQGYLVDLDTPPLSRAKRSCTDVIPFYCHTPYSNCYWSASSVVDFSYRGISI